MILQAEINAIVELGAEELIHLPITIKNIKIFSESYELQPS